MKQLRTQLGGLDVLILDPDRPESRADVNVVFCHGFGAPGDDLVGLGPELAHVSPALAPRVRWVFPEAPLSLASLGLQGGRAWWHIDMERMIQGRDWNLYMEEVPEGLAKARRMALAMLEELSARTHVPMGRTILGGFSQGAMLMTDVTLRLEEAPLGLAILSGALVSRPEWAERASRRTGLPVFQSHGRQDPILPFQVSERLRELLEKSGLKVEFVPFNGPHTIPAGALNALGRWIDSRLAA